MKWSPKMEDRFHALLADGVKDTAIARELGVSRNSVIGKRHRDGLACNPITQAEQAENARRASAAGWTTRRITKAGHMPDPTPKPPRAPPVRQDLAKVTTSAITGLRAYVSGGSRDPTAALAVPRDHPSFAPLPSAAPVPLTELGSRRCCWPVGEAEGEHQLYCGAPAEPAARGETRSPYCPHHLAARTPAAARKRAAA